ncbi:MAG: hypothetical protein IRY90_12585, partial [Actinomadura rubrobrunea]|nr:hypothetical protein [Actinomadura rubrobrunea]
SGHASGGGLFQRAEHDDRFATGEQPMLRGANGPQATGPQPVAATGPHGAVDGSGAHPVPGAAGPQDAFGADGFGVDAQEPYGNDGYGRDERSGFGGDLPVRKPGAHLHGAESVPEAQPAVPEPSPPRQVSWETGPMPPVRPGRLGRPLRRRPADSAKPAGGGRGWDDGPSPEPAAAEETSYADAPYPDEPFAQTASSTGQMPAVPASPAHAPDQPPAQGGPRAQTRSSAPGSSAQDDSTRPPERSPIFDAMQSEWFQRRTGSPGDPVKGWESPADEGFRAAEAAVRRPVAGARTAAGLPKRVPGRNRVPGAVTPQEAAARRRQAQSQSAEVVRNRFASLQRGVRRGRDEARGAAGYAGAHGEGPSQDDGETGGTP